MTRILMVACLCAMAGQAMAQSTSQTKSRTDDQAPPQEVALGVIGKLIGADRRELVPARHIYRPIDAAMVGQPLVNQYVYDNDEEAEARNFSPRDMR